MNKVVRKIFSTRFLDIVPFTVFSVFLFSHFWKQSGVQYFSLLIYLCGLTLWYLGLFHIGKNFHGFSEPKGLVTSGIYSKVQHPIYIGTILSFIGLSIFTQYPLIIFVTIVLIPFQIIRSRIEQKKLEQKYGKKYLNYKKQTWF